MSLLTRLEDIEIIMSEINDNDLVISTTGMISREVFYIKERTSNFYMIGSMGLASSFGLGIAMINKSKRVIVLDGDGSLLMSLNTLPLPKYLGISNFLHICLDNGLYQSTGSQKTISNSLDFKLITKSMGYENSYLIEGNQDELSNLIRSIPESLSFVNIKVSQDQNLEVPRVSIEPEIISSRFSEHCFEK